MKEAELFLTDEFQNFSKRVGEIHERKKAKKEELKKIYEQFQVELKDIEKEAALLIEDWEAWKSQQLEE